MDKKVEVRFGHRWKYTVINNKEIDARKVIGFVQIKIWIIGSMEVSNFVEAFPNNRQPPTTYDSDDDDYHDYFYIDNLWDLWTVSTNYWALVFVWDMFVGFTFCLPF